MKMKMRTATLLRPLLAPLLAILASFAMAQGDDFDDLPMNGLAAFEQLRMEYYIGALQLESMSNDASTVLDAPGRKRMAIHISADRWPALRFAQQWNQAILINNSSQDLNANVMDVLAFTSLPKDDLISGDRLTVDLIPDLGTRVTLNGTPMLQTRSDALFRLLVNTWIGARPPSTGFKKDMLQLSTDSAGTELLGRFEGLNPDDARRKLVAGWGGKIDTAPPVETAVAAAPKPTEDTVVRGRNSDVAPAAAAVAAPAIAAPVVAAPAPTIAAVQAPSVPAASSSAAPATKPEPAPAKPEPAPTPAPAPVETPPEAAVQVASVAPVAMPKPVESTTNIDAATQQALHTAYSNSLRKLIYAELRYPKRAVQKEIEGLVVLRVSSNRNGQLIAADVAQGAHQMLDRAAQQAATKAAPFPAVTADMAGDKFEFMIPVVFKLSN